MFLFFSDGFLKNYLSEFNIQSRFGSTDGITPRTIMTHHSGLPGNWIDGMFATNPIRYDKYANLLHKEYVAYPPNFVFAYSNLGVTLLGDAIEKIAAEPYPDYVQKALLNPLEMQCSNLEMRLTGADASLSYSNGKAVEEYPIGAIPAGALNTTVTDLAHLAMMVNANGKYGSQTVLEPETLRQMLTVQNRDIPLDLGEKIGLGWIIDTVTLPNQEPIYQHDGGTVAHQSSFLVAPDSKLGVIVLSNSDSSNATEIAYTLLKKAWEIKQGSTLTQPPTGDYYPTTPLQTGIYASMLGKLIITQQAHGNYLAKGQAGTFKLFAKTRNRYGIQYKLFGLIPITIDTFKETELYSQNVEGNDLLIASIQGHRYLAGVKVHPLPIPDSWNRYWGEYRILNQLEPEKMQIKKVTAKIEDNFPVIEIETMIGDKVTTILRIINDHEATIEGLGRGAGETIWIENGVFHYAGLKFKRIE